MIKARWGTKTRGLKALRHGHSIQNHSKIKINLAHHHNKRHQNLLAPPLIDDRMDQSEAEYIVSITEIDDDMKVAKEDPMGRLRIPEKG